MCAFQHTRAGLACSGDTEDWVLLRTQAALCLLRAASHQLGVELTWLATHL